MKAIRLGLICVFLAVGAAARADVASYCQAFGHDMADAAASGQDLQNSVSQTPENQQAWDSEKAKALEQCMNLFGHPPAVAAAPPPQPVPVAAAPAPKPAPAPAAVKNVEPDEKLIARARAPALTFSPTQGALAPQSRPQPGTAAWNAYCAKKYTSFDQASGMYTSFHGVRRRCLVTGR